jgi:Leucine-rich repeat (LRR) protein
MTEENHIIKKPQEAPGELPSRSWEEEEEPKNDAEEEDVNDDDDEDSSFGPPPPPPPLTPHPEDTLNYTIASDSLFYDEESPRKTDPPQVSPYSKDSEYNYDNDIDDDSVPPGAPAIDWEEDQSVEIPPTKVVQRWEKKEKRRKKLLRQDKNYFAAKAIASVACCLIVLVIILTAGFGSGAFQKDDEPSSAVIPPPTMTTAPTVSPPFETPVAPPVDNNSTVNRPSALQDLLVSASYNPDAFADVQSAESLAANWLIVSDPLQLDPTKDQFRIQQRYALLTQYFAADGSWSNEEGWLTAEDECTWYGVQCEEVGGGTARNAVVTVNFAANNVGRITPDIAMLTNVTTLNLTGNPWEGGFPTAITNMPQLRSLDLENLGLTDDISSIDFSVFPNMEVLRLRGNFLQGTLNSFYSMTNLVEVQASGGNNLTLAINSSIVNLAKLQILNLNGCPITGGLVSEIGALTALTTIDLGRPAPSNTVGLTGPIPASINQLTQLATLDLSSNLLTGAIPDMTGVPLQILRLSNNNFGQAAIPDSIYTLTGLVELNMANCKLIGSIGTGIGSLTSLRILALDANFLSGALPDAMDQLFQLQSLTLRLNMFETAIPASWTSLVNLQIFDLQNSRIIGPIPGNIGSMASLRELRLSENRITGAIPGSLTQLVLLEELELNTNALTGGIPFDIGSLVNLRILRLHDNTRAVIPGSGLVGQLPSSLGGLTNLLEFEIYDNFMSGPLPWEMGSLVNLQLLDVEFNLFTGLVPDSFAGLSSLQSFYLSGNNFTAGAVLPESLCSIPNLDLVSDCDVTNSCSRCPS